MEEGEVAEASVLNSDSLTEGPIMPSQRKRKLDSPLFFDDMSRLVYSVREGPTIPPTSEAPQAHPAHVRRRPHIAHFPSWRRTSSWPESGPPRPHHPTSTSFVPDPFSDITAKQDSMSEVRAERPMLLPASSWIDIESPVPKPPPPKPHPPEPHTPDPAPSWMNTERPVLEPALSWMDRYKPSIRSPQPMWIQRSLRRSSVRNTELAPGHPSICPLPEHVDSDTGYKPPTHEQNPSIPHTSGKVENYWRNRAKARKRKRKQRGRKALPTKVQQVSGPAPSDTRKLGLEKCNKERTSEETEKALEQGTPRAASRFLEATTDDELMRIENDVRYAVSFGEENEAGQVQGTVSSSNEEGQLRESSDEEGTDTLGPELAFSGDDEATVEEESAEKTPYFEPADGASRGYCDPQRGRLDVENAEPEPITKPKKLGAPDLKALREAAIRGLKRKREPSKNLETKTGEFSPIHDVDSSSDESAIRSPKRKRGPSGKRETESDEFNLICEVDTSSDDASVQSEEVVRDSADFEANSEFTRGTVEGAAGPERDTRGLSLKELRLKEMELMKRKEAELKERLAMLRVGKYSPFVAGSTANVSSASPCIDGDVCGHCQKTSANIALPDVEEEAATISEAPLSQKILREKERERLMQRILAVERKKKTMLNGVDRANRDDNAPVQKDTGERRISQKNALITDNARSLKTTRGCQEESIGIAPSSTIAKGHVCPTSLEVNRVGLAPNMCANDSKADRRRMQPSTKNSTNEFDVLSQVATRAELKFLSASARLSAARTHVRLLEEALNSAKAQNARGALQKLSDPSFSIDRKAGLEYEDLDSEPLLYNTQNFVQLSNEVEVVTKQPSALTAGTRKFVSPMAVLRSYRLRLAMNEQPAPLIFSPTWSHNIDPMKNVCRFELHGRCSKLDCDSQHLRDVCKVSAEKVLQEFREYFGPDVGKINIHSLEKADGENERRESLASIECGKRDAAQIAKRLVKKLMEVTRSSRYPLSPPMRPERSGFGSSIDEGP